MSYIFVPSLDRAVQLHYRTIAYRRMAAVALAIRLYQVDQGLRPPTLSALVPAYLQAVPIDPFVSDGRVLGYLPDDPNPRLYCVNLDGIDQRGRFKLRSAGRVDGDALDLVFSLTDRFPFEWDQAPLAHTEED